MTNRRKQNFSAEYRRRTYKPGKSGNPKGRPRGSKNFATVLQSELKQRVAITEDGRRKKITKREAVAKQLVNKAAAGDPKAIPVLLNATRPYETDIAAASVQAETTAEEDRLVMEHIIKRIIAFNVAALSATTLSESASESAPDTTGEDTAS
jgi:hypothetical protein